jgi:hypothetical protein
MVSSDGEAFDVVRDGRSVCRCEHSKQKITTENRRRIPARWKGPDYGIPHPAAWQPMVNSKHGTDRRAVIVGTVQPPIRSGHFEPD